MTPEFIANEAGAIADPVRPQIFDNFYDNPSNFVVKWFLENNLMPALGLLPTLQRFLSCLLKIINGNNLHV